MGARGHGQSSLDHVLRHQAYMDDFALRLLSLLMLLCDGAGRSCTPTTSLAFWSMWPRARS
eukprot:7621757-Prorocentrum_lima.AAC.1